MLFSTAGQQLFRYAIQHCWTAVVWICYSALLDISGLAMLFSSAVQQLFRYAIQQSWTAVVVICYPALLDSSGLAIQHCWTAVV